MEVKGWGCFGYEGDRGGEMLRWNGLGEEFLEFLGRHWDWNWEGGGRHAILKWTLYCARKLVCLVE